MVSKIVKNQQQVEAGICRFSKELESSDPLVKRLSYARAWYAHLNADGSWCFGPSKFVGYRGMTAHEYINDESRDGRLTERKLASWYSLVEPSDHLHTELTSQLTDFLAEFGKVPSVKARINVANTMFETEVDGQDVEPDQILADLIIAVAKRLKRAERKRIVAAL